MPTETMMDKTMTVAELRQVVHEFVDERDWYQHHTPKNLAMSIAIEAAEIMEHFQWYSREESIAFMEDPANRAEVADELADVMIYCLSFANATGVDVADAIVKKVTRNHGRFPVEQVRGSFGTDGEKR